MTELAAVVNEPAMRYINRLPDHLFVLARTLNDGVKPTSCGVPDKILARIKQVSPVRGFIPYQQLCIVGGVSDEGASPVKRVIDYNVKVRVKVTMAALSLPTSRWR